MSIGGLEGGGLLNANRDANSHCVSCMKNVCVWGGGGQLWGLSEI